DRMLVFGGESLTAGVFDDLWELSLASNQWRQLTPGSLAPAKRSAPAVAMLTSVHRMYLFGGYDLAPTTYDDSWLLSASPTTAALASLLASHANASAVSLTWYVPDAELRAARVSRQDGGGTWIELPAPRILG